MPEFDPTQPYEVLSKPVVTRGSTFGWQEGRGSDSGDNGQFAGGGSSLNDQEDYAALPEGSDVPYGYHFQVRNPDNGAIVWVTRRDKGPAKWTGRGVDLAPSAMRKLGAQTDDPLVVDTKGAVPPFDPTKPYETVTKPEAKAPASYETNLTGPEESAFQQWKAKYAPKDSGNDYDLRGAFKAGLTPDPETGHWPDTFKKPNHPTFSDQSIYAAQAPDKAGHWEGDTYVPPQKQEAQSTTQKIMDFLKKPSPEWMQPIEKAITSPIPGAATAIHAGYQYGSPLGWVEDIAPNSDAGKLAHDIRQQLEQTATGFATPANLALGATTAGVPSAIGRLVGAGFTVAQAKDALDTYDQYQAATDPDQKRQLGIRLGVSGAMTALLGGATLMPHPVGKPKAEGTEGAEAAAPAENPASAQSTILESATQPEAPLDVKGTPEVARFQGEEAPTTADLTRQAADWQAGLLDEGSKLGEQMDTMREAGQPIPGPLADRIDQINAELEAGFKPEKTELTPRARENIGSEIPEEPSTNGQAQQPEKPATIPAAPGMLPATALTRPFRAGMYTGQMTFDSALQRDLYDLGAKQNKNLTANNRGPSIIPMLDHFAARLGISRSDVQHLTNKVYNDVREQMKGLKDEESRTLTDNSGLPRTQQPDVLPQQSAQTESPSEPPVASQPRSTAPVVSTNGEPISEAANGATQAQPEPTQTAEPTQAPIGAAARVAAARDEAGLLGEEGAPESGRGIGYQESVARGNQALDEGADPYKVASDFKKNKLINGDRMGIMRAHLERLQLANARARGALEAAPHDLKLKRVAQDAQDAENAFWRAYKPMQTEWAKIGTGMQESRAITDADVHSQTTAEQAMRESLGRELTPKDQQRAARAVKSVKEANGAVEKAWGKAVESASKQAKGKPMDYAELTKSLAEKLKEITCS